MTQDNRKGGPERCFFFGGQGALLCFHFLKINKPTNNVGISLTLYHDVLFCFFFFVCFLSFVVVKFGGSGGERGIKEGEMGNNNKE